MKAKICALMAFASFIFGQTLASEPQGSWQPGVLLLRNGQVLKGDIANLGDRVQVTLAGGGEIRIPRSSVELQCRNLAEAYAIKSAAAKNGPLSEGLDLAEWCLRQGLLGEAAEQLTLAMRRDPQHPRVTQLERRMQASVTKLPETNEVPRAAVTAQHVPIEELEKTQRELPAGSVEMFTSVVQPLLINRCGANGCHGTATKSNWRIIQPTGGQTITRRFTQRNLHAALATLNRDEPSSSKLLTMARAAHGSAKTAPFGDRDENSYKQLVKWTELTLRGDTPPTPPSSLAEAKTSLLQNTEPAFVLPAAAGKKLEKESTPKPIHSPPAPSDPFDPEVFNRKYLATP